MTDKFDPAEHMLNLVKELFFELHPHRKKTVAVTLDSSLERDLGFDSLARLELLSRIQRTFHASLSERVLATAETARDLLRAVQTATGFQQPIPTEVKPIALGEAKAIPDQAGTLLEVLDWHLQSHPDRPHIYLLGESYQEDAITYRALRQGAESVAAGLKKYDLQPGEAVAIMLPTIRDYFYCFYGILLAGGVPVPLYPPARLSQIEDHLRRHTGILESAAASILIAFPESKPYTRLLKSKSRIQTILTVQEISGTGGEFTPSSVNPQDIALLQYTSGSTGSPKGTILTHANLLANIRAMGQAVQADPTDVFVSWLPLYHDMGLIGAWLGSLYYASVLVLMSPLTFLARPERWLWAIHRYRGTLSAAPNFAYELCIRKVEDQDIQGLDLSSWRMAFNGAEPVSPETTLRFIERFAKYGFRPESMAPVYGLAECSVGLAFPPPGRRPVIDRIGRQSFVRSGFAMSAKEDDPTALRFVACGQPLPGHQVRIVDTTGHEVAERQEGRLQFKGPSATSGYFRNPAETQRLFHGEWLDSGDLGYMVGGDVFITGRIKDIIIRAGRNIYPHELEEAIGNMPGIRKGCVAVFGSTDPASQTERLVVLAETRETNAQILETLRRQINDLAVDLVGTLPDEIILAPPHTVLKTSSGKIRRAASRELYEKGKIRQRPFSAWWQYSRLVLAAIVPQLNHWARVAGIVFYAAYAWALFSILALVTWIGVALLPRPAWGHTVLRTAARLTIRLSGTRFLVQGLDQFPRDSAAVIVINHASYLDSLFLAATLPGTAHYVAKREFLDRFITRIFMRHLGVQFVERFDLQRGISDARQIADVVRHGRSVVFFPEGTFGRMPGLLPFHMGAFVVAAEAGVPIIPVTIRGTRAMLRAGQWFPRRGNVSITVAPPIRPEGSDWPAAIKLKDASRAEMLQHLGEPDLAHYTQPV